MGTSTIAIRDEQPGDENAIRDIVTAAFPTDAEAKLVDSLRASGELLLSLVAEMDGQLVGHVAMSPVHAERSGWGWGLAPLAVIPHWQRHGIGSKLMEEALARCKCSGVRYAVLLGSPAYYGRFGFQPASRWNLVDEYRGGDAFQAIEFVPGALHRGHTELVRYAPPFSEFLPE